MEKAEKYKLALSQIKAITENEQSQTANLANISAILKEHFAWWWVGFYIVDQDQLVLGPFQGPVACTRIDMGKGVCGSAWARKETIVVDNVHDFPGHIACSAESLSEVVIPIMKEDEVKMVLDVDSELEAHFDDTDKENLEELALHISSLI